MNNPDKLQIGKNTVVLMNDETRAWIEQYQKQNCGLFRKIIKLLSRMCKPWTWFNI